VYKLVNKYLKLSYALIFIRSTVVPYGLINFTAGTKRFSFSPLETKRIGSI
jgi:hypothetical protein